MSEPRIFYDTKKELIYLIEQGPCSCHPFDLIITWGKGFYSARCFSFKNQREIDKYLSNWIEL